MIVLRVLKHWKKQISAKGDYGEHNSALFGVWWTKWLKTGRCPVCQYACARCSCKMQEEHGYEAMPNNHLENASACSNTLFFTRQAWPIDLQTNLYQVAKFSPHIMHLCISKVDREVFQKLFQTLPQCSISKRASRSVSREVVYRKCMWGSLQQQGDQPVSQQNLDKIVYRKCMWAGVSSSRMSISVKPISVSAKSR